MLLSWLFLPLYFRCTFGKALSQLMGRLPTFLNRPGYSMELFKKTY